MLGNFICPYRRYYRNYCARHLYRGAPSTTDMIRLVRDAVDTFGAPRFLITDHGCQFRRRFKRCIESIGITHVRGRVRCPTFKGKVMRLFEPYAAGKD